MACYRANVTFHEHLYGPEYIAIVSSLIRACKVCGVLPIFKRFRETAKSDY